MNEPIPIDSFTQGSPKWLALRKRALSDLYFFASVILGLGDKIPMRPKTHLLLCRFIEGKTGSPLLDDAHYKKIEMPRETGKSSLIRARAIQRICKNPNIALLLINEKELLVRDFLQSIKYEFENNELLRALFPEVMPADLNDTTWSATRIIVNRKSSRPDPTIDVAGVGAALAGKHPDEIYCDDMISREAMENARAGAWQIMHATNRWIHQLDPIVNKSAEPFPLILFCGTRWWHNDSYEHIEEAYGSGEDAKPVILRAQLPDGTIQQVTAYRKGELAIFRRAAIEEGQSIFPEKWSLEDLARLRVRDPQLFAANYMNAPADEITATFKTSWLDGHHFTWLDDDKFYFTTNEAKKEVRQLRDCDLLLLVDPGGFGDGSADDRARAALVLVGDDCKGNYFLLDIHSERDTYLHAIQKVVEWCIRYVPRRVYVERAGQQAAFASLLRSELQKASVNVSVDDTTLKPGGRNKDVRILEMEPFYQRGQVYVGAGPQFHEFKTQFAQFPNSKRRDILDILGYWPSVMRRTGATAQSHAARRAAELAAYRARRAS